jgi:hypothetical protein
MSVPPTAMIGCIPTEISVYICHLVVKWKINLDVHACPLGDCEDEQTSRIRRV